MHIIVGAVIFGFMLYFSIAVCSAGKEVGIEDRFPFFLFFCYNSILFIYPAFFAEMSLVDGNKKAANSGGNISHKLKSSSNSSGSKIWASEFPESPPPSVPDPPESDCRSDKGSEFCLLGSSSSASISS